MIPEDAFISPDDPMILDKFRDALISPEEPLMPREQERGTVVGMDGSTKLKVDDAEDELLHPDRVADIIHAVTAGLREQGIIGLQPAGEVSTFEENLKIHLTEYFSKHN